MAAFAARLQDSVDLGTVRADLLGVVEGALEPAHLSMWVTPVDMSPGPIPGGARPGLSRLSM